MEDDVAVRPATTDDVDGIYEVMRQSRQDAFNGLLPPEALDWAPDVSDGFRQFIKGTLSHREKLLLVAVRGETIVGLAELVWYPEETAEFVESSAAELKAMHVRPTNWNEGIGTKLLDEAIDTLSPDVSGIGLCVLSENERARAFYERREFEQTGTTVTMHADNEFREIVYHRSL